MMSEMVRRSAAGVLALFLAACGGGSNSSNSAPVSDPDTTAVGCLDDSGLDLFAVEASHALALSWNNQGGLDASGGYRVRYGFGPGDYDNSVDVACTALDCETTLTELDNDVVHYLVVDAVNGSNNVSGTSCEVTATPHDVQFAADLPVSSTSATQSSPTVATGWDGTPLFVGWVEGATVYYSRSDDHGNTWSTPTTLVATGGVESDPSFFFRRRIVETNPDTGELEVIVPPALLATFVVDGQVKLMVGDFPNGSDQPVEFGAIVDLGSGAAPDVAAYADHIEAVYARDDGIWARSSSDNGSTFNSEQRVDVVADATQVSAAPDVVIDPNNDDVFIGYEGQRGEGNTDIYLNYSRDGGATYQASEVRVDDDMLGSNQSNVSIAVDPRTSHVLATWEDRRDGSSVYFSRSLDRGATWEMNVKSGAGLTGDQFEPVADVDPGRNVYVLFIDTTNGQKPLFARFNALGSFDAPLEVSSTAGQAGAVARSPVLTIDKLGRFYAAWIENRDGQPNNVFFARAE